MALHRIPCAVLLVAVLVAAPTVPVAGQRTGPVVTEHQIRADGHVWSYSAEAGRLPVHAVRGSSARGTMFYVAYVVHSGAEAGAPRPLLFLWGGGPSDPALGLQPVFGPKRVVDGRVVDNPLTLLTVADLVFVDPVGTGFSRAARPRDEQAFYNVLGDQASLADFVRSWRARYGDPDAPLFLYGVSYGTWRVSGVSELLEKRGIHVAGAILQSGGIQFGADALPRALRTALRVPGYAAAALVHDKLAPGFGTERSTVVTAARRWALDTYAPALAHVSGLDEARRDTIAAQLSRWTGYPLDRISRTTLAFTPRQYLRGLLPGDTLDTYDMREIRGPTDTLTAVYRRGLPPMLAYVRGALRYHTDLAYLGVGPRPDSAGPPPGARWEYNSGTITPEAMADARAGEGPPGTEPWLRRAMALDSGLKVLVGAGLYDSLNSCSANEALMARIAPAEADRFTLKCYPSGHDFHRDPAVTPRFIEDMKAFIAGTVQSRDSHTPRDP